MKELDNLVRTAVLKQEPANQTEINGLLGSADKRLADAEKAGLSLESQFDLAYNAAHAFALAALRSRGYRPNKRYIVFLALPHTLGLGPEVWRVLDKCHGVRNNVEYEGALDVSEQLVTDLLKATKAVKLAVHKLGSRHTSAPSRK